jgi:hypothetical protein
MTLNKISELTPAEFLKDFTKDTNGELQPDYFRFSELFLASWMVVSLYSKNKKATT